MAGLSALRKSRKSQRATYQQVADFFVHFSDIIHEYAPNVKTVMCIGGIEHPEKGEEMEMEKEFAQCVPAADVWSVDKYMALHWGWPFDVAEPGGTSHSRSKVEDTYKLTKLSYETGNRGSTDGRTAYHRRGGKRCV